jgi:two-component system sensor histidine kinase HydH
MRRALTLLVVATALLAASLVAIAAYNWRAARALADDQVEVRAFEEARRLVQRVSADLPLSVDKARPLLEDLLGEEVLYAAVDWPDGTPLVDAGPVPPLDVQLAREAVRRVRSGGGDAFVRRRIEVQGEEVEEFVIAAANAGRRPNRPAARALRELFGGGAEGGAGRGRPVLRLGMRLAAYDPHIRHAGLALLLALIIGPLTVAAAGFAAWTGRRAERTRERSARRERLASLGELAATVAHEVRNPLGAIKGYAQLVEEGTGGETAQRAARTIRDECERMERTVTQVLGYARDAQPRLEPLELRALLDAELGRLAADAAAREVRLVRDYGDEPVELRADRDQLARALGNLVHNALAASPPGARVVVGLRPERRQVELFVADEGPGVAEEDRARVFEPFFSRRAGGTGLGLALVRRIAEAHGGSVGVATRAAGGAEFVLRLPR